MTTTEQIEKAKQVDLLALLGNIPLQGGDEQYGPCVICKAGQDRFHIKPAQNVWFCSRCTGRPDDGGWQDTIEMVKRLHNLDFAEAVAWLINSPSPLPPPPRPTSSKTTRPPPFDWQSAAKKAAVNLADEIWRPDLIKARAWLNDRGIDDSAIIRYSLGYTHGGNAEGIDFKMGRGIVIPHWSECYQTMFALKVRRPVIPGASNKYYCATGSKIGDSLFNSDSLTGKDVCFVTEGELDALALHSKIGARAAVVTLGAKKAKLADRWLADLYHIKRFYIATDQGEDEEAADYWLSLVGKRGQRVFLPDGVKDVCEAAKGGLDLKDWALTVIQKSDERM